ncbi:hypothetical protein [Plantactinospora sonchi]|uniref:Septum formation-related domain-containing protein n=1 Tax=Plantactinospora sonchi TaxID=1544735 RepID=A0ABU7RVV7_9ACTN
MRRASRVVAAGVLLAVLAGCTDQSRRSASASDPVDNYLGLSDCVAPTVPDASDGTWREVACDDPAAVASVTQVENGGAGLAGAFADPDCPTGTDHAIRVISGRLAGRAGSHLFACVRNLKPPHPGDPGQGGGPDIVVGDCVYSEAHLAKVEETPCDGSGDLVPTHRVTLVTTAICPPGSAATFTIGRAQLVAPNPLHQQVACADEL